MCQLQLYLWHANRVLDVDVQEAVTQTSLQADMP